MAKYKYQNTLVRYAKNDRPAFEGDEWYEIIQEAIDRVIMYSSDEYELFVPTRMIVWNMLVLAYADSEYHPQEKN